MKRWGLRSERRAGTAHEGACRGGRRAGSTVRSSGDRRCPSGRGRIRSCRGKHGGQAEPPSRGRSAPAPPPGVPAGRAAAPPARGRAGPSADRPRRAAPGAAADQAFSSAAARPRGFTAGPRRVPPDGIPPSPPSFLPPRSRPPRCCPT